MKKMLILLLCLAAVVGLQAQTAIPYTQGFESSSLPSGWSHIGSGTAACQTSYPHTGTYSLKFSGATADNVVKLPTFAQEIANLEIAFWSRPEGTSSSGNFDIGYLTNPASASSFVAVETYNCATEGTTYQQHIATFAGAPAGSVIALRHRSGASNWYWFVDDVEVYAAPTCIAVDDLRLTSIDSTSATINWSSDGSAWRVDLIDAAGDTTTFSTTDSTYTFSGLTPITSYTAIVYTDCDDEISRAKTISFRTECGQVAFPYINNFEQCDANVMVPCWTVINESSSYPVKVYGSASSYSDFSPKFLYINCPATIATPKTPIPLNQVELSFDYTFENVAYINTFYVGYATNLAGEITYFDTVTAPSNYVNHAVASYVGNLSGTDVTEEGYIIISREGSSNYLMAIDNFAMNAISNCARPANVTISDVTNESAVASWSDTAWAGAFDVAYGTVDDFSSDSTQIIPVTDTTYMFENLPENTKYYFWVRSNCGGETSPWVVGGIFRTACDPFATDSLPYVEDFDSYTASSSVNFNSCWTIKQSGTSYYPYISTTNHRSGSNSLYFYNCCAAMPMMESDVNTLQLTFWVKYSSANPFAVGIMTNPSDPNTFDTVTTGVATSDWSKVEVPLGGYTGTGRYIAIRTNNYMYIDDLTVDFMPACPTPTNFRVDSLDADYAEISWTENGTATTWTVELVAGTDTEIETAYSNERFELSNLTSNTLYTVNIYPECSDSIHLTATFRTPCTPVDSLPYTDNFDSYTASSTAEMNPCWKTYTSGSSHYPYISSTSPYSGSRCLYFSSSSNYYLALPLFDEPVNTLQISFYKKYSSTYPFAVGVMTDPSNLATFDTIATGVTTSTWQLVEVPFGGYTGTGRYIAIRTSNYMYVDDITVDLIPACPRPSNLVIDSVASDMVALSWTENGEATSWTVVYGVDNDSMSVTANTNEGFEITDLAANTGYWVKIYPECSEEATPFEGSFRTACGELILPYSDNFDNDEVNVMVPCWTVLSENSTYPVKVNTSSSYTSFTANYLHINAPATIATPKTPIALNQVEMSFDYTMESSTNINTFYIGYATSLNSDIVYVDTVMAPAGYDFTNRPAVNFNYSFADCGVEEPAYIIFMRQGSSNYLLAFDNFVMNEIPECSRPENLSVDSVDVNSATLSWSDYSNTPAFDLVYGLENNPDDSSNTLISGIYDTTYTITGLNSSTSYNAWVRANCGGDFSPWVSFVGFATACATINSLPWVENFEAMTAGAVPNCWDNSGSATSSATANPHYVWGVYAYGGNQMIRMYNYLTQSGLALINTPAVEIPSTGSYILSFDYSHKASSDSLYVKISTDGSNFTRMTAFPKEGTTYDYTNPGEFTSVELDLTAYAGETVIFQFSNQANYGSGAIFIDNVAVMTAPTCMKPTDLAASGVTNNAATITWQGSESNYEVAYHEADSAEVVLPATGNTLPLSGLNANTTYYYKVRAICGVDDTSAWTRESNFTTACAPATVPYVQNFENATTGSSNKFDACWSVYYTGSYYYPYVSSGTGYDGSKYLYFGTTSSYYAAMPLMNEDLDQLQVSFAAKASYSTTSSIIVNVGVMSNPNDVNTFELIESVPVTSNWDVYTVYLSAYLGTGRYIAFRNGGSVTFYLDSVAVDYKPSCTPPASLAVVDIDSANATISWVETDVATSWQAEYRLLGDSAWTVLPTATGTSQITITGLTPSTAYEFRVKALCTDTSSSDYSSVFSFRTECGEMEIPYLEDFESYAAGTGNQPACWGDLSSASNPYVQDMSSYSSWSGPTFGKAYHLNGTNVVVTPRLPRALNTLSISFKAAREGESSNTLEVGFIPTLGTPIDSMVVLTTLNYSNYKQYVDEEIVGSTTGIADMGYIVFRSTGSTAWYWWLDNVAIEDIPTCPRVADVMVDTVTQNSVTIDWTDAVTPMAYEIDYGEVGHEAGTGISVIVTAHPATISGLNPASSYDFYVRPICSTTDTGFWTRNACHASTACGIVSAPYAQNFDGITATTYSAAGELPPCWEGYSNGTSDTYSPHVVGSGSYYYAVNGNSMVMTCGAASYGDTKIVRLPEFQQPVNSLTLSYWLATESSTNGTLSVGYLTSDDFSTFVSVKDIPASSSTYNTNGGIYDTVSFDSVPAEAMYVAFRWYFVSTSFYSCCIDEVAVESSLVGCQAPVIVSNSNDYNSFTATWSGSAESYEVSYMAITDADYSTPVTVNAHTYTLTGLAPATQYDFRVRSLCDSGEVSAWTNVNFTTDSLPCFVPEALQQTAVSYTSVTLDWTNGGNEQNWVVKVFNSRIGEILDTVSAHPATITGLTANEQYFATVQAACGNNLDGFSDWSDTISFTTSECVAVSNISCATPTNSSVEISWTSNGSESAWIVEYGMPGFGQGEEMGRATATTNPYQLSLAGLDPNTTYEVYVYAQCMEGLTSVPAGPASFTTNDIGISGISGNADINIYPNPTTGSTTISVSGISGKVTIDIVDMNGRTIKSTVQQINDSTKVNVEGLAQGAYFVRIYGEEINSIRKLIVR